MIAVSGTVAGKDRGFRVHWAWVVLGSSFITLFVTYGIRIGAYSVLLPEMIKDLQITKTQAGMIKSAFSMVYLILAPLMGWLTDRIGGRKVISFFCLFWGGGTFLMSQADRTHPLPSFLQSGWDRSGSHLGSHCHVDSGLV